MAERNDMLEAGQPGHYGAGGSSVLFARATIAAAWNIQGNAVRAPFIEEVQRLFGVRLPTAPNTFARTDVTTALWLGPTSWLLVAGGASPLVDFAAKRGALNASGGALFDVSASRIAWRISGPNAATVLGKGCPLDFHPRAFLPGACAQSLLGRIAALFVKHDDAPTFTLMAPRSYARDAWHALAESAAQYGLDVQSAVAFP